MVADIFVLQNGIYRLMEIGSKEDLDKLNGKDIEHLDIFEKDDTDYAIDMS